MEVYFAGGSAAKPDTIETIAAWYVWEGSNRYIYHKFYKNGVYTLTKTLVETKRAATSSGGSNSSRKASSPPAKKSAPKPVPKPAAPSAVAKPSFGLAKPTPVSAFSWNVAEPVKREVIVPQPPPVPRPKPVFDFKKQKSITKFEYLYGIKHLELKHMQYQDKSIYVSKPISVSGNVMQVSMQAVEEHPIFDELGGAAADRQTSIEYYIASVGTNPNPTLNEWYPILPEEDKTVKSELLMFGTARTAELRFHALISSKEAPIVYKNGLKMKSNEWSFADGGKKVQLLIDKEPTAIYTINYTPNASFYNPWTIDINQKGGKPVKHTQLFPAGTNHNKTIVLEKYPYVNYEKINGTTNYDSNVGDYVPIKVTLKDAGIIGIENGKRVTYKNVQPYNGTTEQKAYTKNINNYKTGIHQELKPYSIDPETAYAGLEYYHEADKLYFSETFNKADIYVNEKESHGNATIAVEYEYLSSDFRMKIIMRRNSTDENTLTPVVHEYALKFKVMK